MDFPYKSSDRCLITADRSETRILYIYTVILPSGNQTWLETPPFPEGFSGPQNGIPTISLHSPYIGLIIWYLSVPEMAIDI